MKTRIAFLTIFLITFFMASCTPVTTLAPTTTLTVVPSATLVPTVTATPTPETLADAKDLPAWVDEFVHAYGGKVTVNGAEMDAVQLTVEIRKNGEAYMQNKKVNGIDYMFIVVNGIPLAFQEKAGKWQEATMAKLSDFTGVIFTFESGYNDLQKQRLILRKMCGHNCEIVFAGDLTMDNIFRDFTARDWQAVLSNWSSIQKDFVKEEIPSYPYYWGDINKSMFDYKGIDDTLQFRATGLLSNNLNSSGFVTEEGVTKQIADLNLLPENNLKLLEFMVRSRVIKFTNITKWDVSDEVMANYVSNDPNSRAWNILTGLPPSDLIKIIANWVKQDNPDAKTIVNEHSVFNHNNPWTKPIHDGTMELLKQLHNNNAPVDGFIDQNNLWIGIGLNDQLISDDIDYINSLGFKILGSETMIGIGGKSINGNTEKVNPVEGKTDEEKQANMYRQLLKLYLSKGINIFGFGSVEDNSAWTNFTDLPNANPLLFDDWFRAKPSYYAVVKVLYERIQ